MNFETLTKRITKTCHEAIDQGASIETVIAALHVVHESAMLTYIQNNMAGAALEDGKP